MLLGLSQNPAGPFFGGRVEGGLLLILPLELPDEIGVLLVGERPLSKQQSGLGFKFTLGEVEIAGFEQGPLDHLKFEQGAAELDLRTIGVVLEKNGEIVAMAAGAAVLGHPAAAIALLANKLAERNKDIPAGTFIMTGGVTEAIPVIAGDAVNVRFQDLGSVSMRFV